MTEQLPHTSPVVPTSAEIQPGSNYNQLIQGGLERSRMVGFDFESSVHQNYGEDAAIDVAERQGQILETSAMLAQEARLDPEFFERPVNTVLLTAIADSWVDNQSGLDSPDPRERAKAEAEKAMLEDVLLMAAGDKSGYVRDMAVEDPERAYRYAESGFEDPDETAYTEFLKSINDEELAAEVSAVFAQTGEGSFLEAQRTALNIDPVHEQPFGIKVMKMADRWDLVNAGLFDKIEWPEYDADLTPEDRAKQRPLWDAAMAKSQEQDAFVEPYQANIKEYEERFGAKFGELSPAFVSTNPDGSRDLYLRADQAYTLINYFAKGRPMPENPYERDQIIGVFHIVKHEYIHTQKQMSLGRHVQLGLLTEERKAELLSDDKHGYIDVKSLYSDVQMATGVSITDTLSNALKEEDALSSFTAQLSSSVGLRTALLMTVATPVPYEKHLEHAKKFADISHIRTESDASNLDAIVSGVLERKGDAQMNAGAAKFVNRFESEKLAFMKESYLPYRRAHGLTHGADYMEAALDERIEQEAA